VRCPHAFLLAPTTPLPCHSRACCRHAAGATHSWRASLGVCRRRVRLSVLPLLWAAGRLRAAGLLLPTARGVCAATCLCRRPCRLLPCRRLRLPAGPTRADRSGLLLPHQPRGEHANLWEVITPRLMLPFCCHSPAGSLDSFDGRRPQACRSARRCVRRGRAARWPGSSASAASCSCAWPRSR